ncbi:hypothetical protein [Rhodoligotrophos defluvii]|uniref:hypothetical protein n=1 Tax=Rhodoligotrophos defluvii TaxID=2561934 RepID=UPI0010C9DF56|nr:hypothetical protein [Rhodoligotrophos defluvii]
MPPPPPGFVLQQSAPPAAADVAEVRWATPTAPEPAPLQLGAQAVGRGVADLIGLPVDLMTGAMNAGISGANLFGADIPQITEPVGGSDWIANTVGSGVEALGADLIDPEQLGLGERILYEASRFGTGALGGAGGLARRAASGLRPAETAIGQMIERYAAPYAGGASRPVIGDTAAGLGSGAAVGAYEGSDLDDTFGPLGTVGAAVLGGIGGSTLADVPGTMRRGAEAARGFTTDTSVPRQSIEDPTVSRRVADHAASFVQGRATDPEAAAQRFGQRLNDARAYGEPVPSADIGSDDIGLIALGRGARHKDSVRFQEADERLANAAQANVVGLKDPAADQSAATRFAQDRPKQIASERDAAALPLLQQAEARGAVVDAAPIAQLIEQKLATAKRPPVRAALTEARRMLNKVGSDELDNTVAGLYEARKAINDVIEGRGENPTGRFAQKELIEVRKALDEAISAGAPEFRDYLDKFRSGSEPLDIFSDSATVARLLEDDPRNVAKRIFGGDTYGTEKQLEEINKVLGSDPDAKRAWKAAVSEVLADKVTGTNTALTGGAPDGPVSIAKLQKVFKQHEKALAEVYSPAEMNALRRAHKMLEPLGNLRRTAVAGSPTEENRQIANSFEAAILFYTNDAIKTGMIMKRIKTMMNLLPATRDLTLESKIGKLVNRMWFDPELFQHLLTRPVAEMEKPSWNAKLNRLLAVGAGARETSEE